ncbi:1,3-beta-glucan synthase component-domain-containing protein [Chytridium lagenaria]|nr:1,3-beta-glucan synthase component-domain-containing protein [Chytridium lagenaria]
MESISQLKLTSSGELFWSIPSENRYVSMKDVNWRKAFKKTFYERRSIGHAFCNFSRIWILHLTFFWAFIVFVAEPIAFRSMRPASRFVSRLEPRQSRARNDTETKITELMNLYRWAAVSMSGAVAALLGLVATILESSFLPRDLRRSRHLGRRSTYFLLLFFLNLAPGISVFYLSSRGTVSYIAVIIGLVLSVLTLGIALFIPPSRFPFKSREDFQRSHGAAFTANFAKQKRVEHLTSVGIWIIVFASKLIESLVFLIMPLGKPIEILVNTFSKKNECKGFGMICVAVKCFSVLNLVALVVVLYFLDTYMWWIVWSTALGVTRSLLSGLSALTPWRNAFARLPERMLSKILNTQAAENENLEKSLCGYLWNAIVLSMSLDHLLSLKQLKKLAYWKKAGSSPTPNRVRIKQPRFFLDQEDVTTKNYYVLPGSEAERRINFFAKSLSMTFPTPSPISKMPSFSVLTPHYSEKILLSLRDIIKEHDTSSTLTLLEYLKSLYPHEWENFLFDTKLGAGDFASVGDIDEKIKVKGFKDIPLSEVGFREHSDAAILRTRIWASLRSQTLFRTVAGFMNYAKAISLLHKVETSSYRAAGTSTLKEHRDDDPGIVARKFTFVLAMQNFQSFDPKQVADTEVLLRIFPNLRIGYLEKVGNEGEETTFYSDSEGRRVPLFRIKLPGNPFLGDGKADNQNLNMIWTRGEFLQLIDANQVRSLLAEFQETEGGSPVAIVGAREHIFSEGVGVLGDVAAGKEYSFGTIVQRVTAKLGGRLHYGHPDFLNAVFMNTRGGVSKAQKGLCVNEDIFAGMNALLRGGRIKHTEYLQCGKGRDLGVLSISKFNAKIGSGMVAIASAFTFYYGHPGFHLNNVFIMIALQLFITFLMILSVLHVVLPSCPDSTDSTVIRRDCFDFEGVAFWIKQAVFAIVVVFEINFLPLFLQLLTEQGFGPAILRTLKQLVSLSPLFDYGRAGYISTGRGFATSRSKFFELYSAFADSSIYLGMRLFLILLFVTCAVDIPHLAFFWIMVLPLSLAPFFFNPHQFVFSEFVLDFRESLGWLWSEKTAESWFAFNKQRRAILRGSRRKRNHDSALSPLPKPKMSVLLMQELGGPLIFASLGAAIFVAGVAFLPVVLNAAFLAVGFVMAILAGNTLGCCLNPSAVGNVISFISRCWALLAMSFAYVSVALLNRNSPQPVTRTMLALIAFCAVEQVLVTLITLCLPREPMNHKAGGAWWGGRWFNAGLGWRVLTQPLREWVCKITEMTTFAGDFIVVLLLPIACIPFIDTLHTSMLLWTNPFSARNKKRLAFRSVIMSVKLRRVRRFRIFAYTFGLMFFVLLMGIVSVAPLVLPLQSVAKMVGGLVDRFIGGMVKIQ